LVGRGVTFKKYGSVIAWIYIKVKVNHIKENLIVELKKFWYCDFVLKIQNQEDILLVFLREITETTVVD
jgi:hypothetical protein